MSSLGVVGELNESKRLEWKISNFSSLHAGDGCFFESPSFKFANASLYFRLYLLPSGKNRISLSIYLIDESKRSCGITLSLQKSDGTLIGTRTVAKTTLTSRGFCNFFDASDLKKFELLPADVLIISCDLKYDVDGIPLFPPSEEAVSLKKSEVEMKNSSLVEKSKHMILTEVNMLSKNFKDLFMNEECCDLVLLVQGKEFKVHRNILIARSSVFAAMFRHDTTEKKTGQVVIPDCEPDSFQKFLEYLYCGKLEDISCNNAIHLYRASDKYNVQELKIFCTKYLAQNLTIQSVCDVVALADEYDEKNLFSLVQEFFNKNLQKILLTSEWENLFKENSVLANRLLIEMSKK